MDIGHCLIIAPRLLAVFVAWKYAIQATVSNNSLENSQFSSEIVFQTLPYVCLLT